MEILKNQLILMSNNYRADSGENSSRLAKIKLKMVKKMATSIS